MTAKDIFICHASEDKEEIVQPLVEAFSQAGITCWYDEAEINWGDSITQRVNEGLRLSQYVMIVFTTAFLTKKWPQRELNAVLNMEASSGDIKILPLLVGSDEEQESIIRAYPLLNDKRYLPWNGKVTHIVKSLLARLNKAEQVEGDKKATTRPDVGMHIPLPKIKKSFTQRDKDIFLKKGFSQIKQYFQQALVETNRAYAEVETDLEEIHNFKFICTIYMRGEVKNRCKIWLGGLTGSDSIAYQAGQFNLDSDSSFNDVLAVEDNGEFIGFKPMFFGSYQKKDAKLYTPIEAATYLWEEFTGNLR